MTPYHSVNLEYRGRTIPILMTYRLYHEDTLYHEQMWSARANAIIPSVAVVDCPF